MCSKEGKYIEASPLLLEMSRMQAMRRRDPLNDIRVQISGIHEWMDWIEGGLYDIGHRVGVDIWDRWEEQEPETPIYQKKGIQTSLDTWCE